MKVGDKVYVTGFPVELMDKSNKQTTVTGTKEWLYAEKELTNFFGREATITKIAGHWVRLDIDQGDWLWSPDWLELVTETSNVLECTW